MELKARGGDKIKVHAVADEGYYLNSLSVNGSEVFTNDDMTLTDDIVEIALPKTSKPMDEVECEIVPVFDIAGKIDPVFEWIDKPRVDIAQQNKIYEVAFSFSGDPKALRYTVDNRSGITLKHDSSDPNYIEYSVDYYFDGFVYKTETPNKYVVRVIQEWSTIQNHNFSLYAVETDKFNGIDLGVIPTLVASPDV